MKVMQARTLNRPKERGTAQRPTPGGPLTHDLNVPYDGTNEYKTPTADMLFPPTPLQTTLPMPIVGTADNSSMYNISSGSSDYPTPASENGNNVVSEGRTNPYMTPQSTWTNPRLDVNVAYVDGRDGDERGNSNQQFSQDLCVPSSGKQKCEENSAQYQNVGSKPQQDGAGDMPKGNLEDDALRLTNVGNRKVSSKFPQVDGRMADPYDEVLSTPNEGGNDELNEARTPAVNDTQTNTPITAQNHINEDDDDELLNEDDDELLNEDDDDDEELDDLENNENTNTQDLVLAQFDKVTRRKGRWKCTLEDGIMHINDKDVLFSKVTGVFDF